MKGGKSKADTKSSKLAVNKKPAKASKAAAKDPNKPKRPSSAFFVFMEDFRQTYKKDHPNNKSVAAEEGPRRTVLRPSHQTPPLLIFSDSQVLVKILHSRAPRKELNNILNDIWYYSGRLTACSFLHIPRLCNVEADQVAKSALVSVNSSSLSGG
ncbi:hypothetical protein Bca52824_032064 [Brassica carinata]|uniref:HMG box domain-containing protein n=1 Tax=Brassica carinata TaxID=52824 RepID=A0A8X7S9A4_BRACI|nr:hypothetical protein Bca52824_032064 [Brassica carinata]